MADVTQVVAADEGVLFHNRLTHSLKVAQIARRIAERLRNQQASLLDVVGGLDPDVAEAAALAHDLGHPPFGHIAEKALDELSREVLDGFEGNAQSFRIVTKLSIRKFDQVGLNLSRATLNAISKYPWLRGPTDKKKRKWGAYASEEIELQFARSDPYFKHEEIKSAEAEIMDWADDIAYSLHDVEDFYRIGWVPLDRLRRDKAEQRDFFEHVYAAWPDRSFERAPLEERIIEILKFAPPEPYSGAIEQRAILRAFVGRYIGLYANAIRLRRPTTSNLRLVEIDEKREEELLVLKELVKFYVINNPSLATHQEGQIHIIRELYRKFSAAAGLDEKTPNQRLFPKSFQGLLRDADDPLKRRLVVDLIAGLTEKQAIRLYQRLAGIAPGSALDSMIYLTN